VITGRERGTTVTGTLIACLNRASDRAYVLVRTAAGEGDEPLGHN
jgi:hypothetical protein